MYWGIKTKRPSGEQRLMSCEDITEFGCQTEDWESDNELSSIDSEVRSLKTAASDAKPMNRFRWPSGCDLLRSTKSERHPVSAAGAHAWQDKTFQSSIRSAASE